MDKFLKTYQLFMFTQGEIDNLTIYIHYGK